MRTQCFIVTHSELNITFPVLQKWGLDFRDQMNVAKDYFGQYSAEAYANRAQTIVQEHDKSKVNVQLSGLV